MRKPKLDISFETPGVEFETPVREIPQKPGCFDAGYCWCGKRIPGCTGDPTKVNVYGPKAFMFICPNGRDESSITKELFEAAKKAGLVS